MGARPVGRHERRANEPRIALRQQREEAFIIDLAQHLTGTRITELTGRPQNLVSYHLRALRAAGLPVLPTGTHIVPVIVGDAKLCKAAAPLPSR